MEGSEEAAGKSQQLTADTTCISWVRSKLQLLRPLGLEETEDSAEWLASVWQNDVHTPIVSTFLMSVKATRMFALLDTDADHSQPAKLVLTLDVPKHYDQMVYFVRDPSKFVTRDNVSNVIFFGVMRGGDPLHSLLKIMHGLYVPVVVANTSWPETVKSDFTAQMHKFMANLTETVYEVKGKTILYIPQEDLRDPKAAAKQKDLVQRLESTIIHWTRQVKELLNQQDAVDASEQAGPLAEIEFWRERSVDLSGIRAQLDDGAVSSIVSVLEYAKSSYLAPFLSLRNLIHREAVAAEDNLKFLLCLEEPCKQLAAAHPQTIPGLLPPILNCIRMVWNLSRFYNTPERLTVLLRKLSNEIINRCCSVISLADVFSGDVDNVMTALRQSMEAGERWKELYKRTAAAVAVRSPRPWDFDISSIFAHIDAFLQRCKDLLEVCEAQLQFAPRTPLPVFGGTYGPEVKKSIVDIQESFQGLVRILKSLTYDILDVKATRWHDDFNAFKSGVKDLEVMMANVIQRAFDTQPCLLARGELLEGFQAMAKRDFIRRFVEKKTVEFFGLFMAEINTVKKLFDAVKRSQPKSPILPRYAGLAKYAMNLMRRLEQSHKVVDSVRYTLPQVAEAAEVLQQYELAHQAIEQYIANTHNEWFGTIESSIAKELQTCLLVQDKAAGGLLSMNFHKDLLSMGQEVHFWERMRLAVPLVAMEINAQREKYRVLRDNILMVVRDYNKILTALDKEERKLFHDRIRYLDRRIMPGVTKLQWTADKHALEFYYREARKFCRDADMAVGDYKAANARLDAICRSISELVLVDVEKKKIYQHTEFATLQEQHHAKIKDRLVSAVDEIREIMAGIHRVFEQDSEEVQREWVRFTQKVDRKLEDALRHVIKKSLQELSRLLNGDNKTEVMPIFHVTMVLERTNRVELRPTIQALFDTINSVARNLIIVLQSVPRVAMQLTDKQRRDMEEAGLAPPKPLPTLYETISQDEDAVLRTIMQITSGITSVIDKVQSFLTYWEKKYRQVWEADRDAYIRRYEKAQKPLSSFEADIARYLQLIEEIRGEDSATNMRFLRIDCGPLKQTLVGHCEAWVAKFTGLLGQLALAELKALHAYFKEYREALCVAPASLEQLAELVGLHRRLADERRRTEARFEPLRDKYKLLERYEVGAKEEEAALLEALEPAWTAFQALLDETAGKLERYKDNFREKVKNLLDSFLKDVASLCDEFTRDAPYSSDVPTKEAVAFVTSSKQAVEDTRKRALEIKSGMDIFNIPQPQYKDLAAMEKDLDLLDRIWGLKSEWEHLYSGWKDGSFADIKVDEMEDAAVRISKNVAKLGRDIRHWTVWSALKDTLDAFKRTMPLITDLRNPAMRPRHWEALQTHIGIKFDPHSRGFTLDSVVALRLDQHVDFVAELSVNATKELAIENNIKTIAATWSTLLLDMAEYKSTFKLRSTEEIFSSLEENTVTLSTMKASKYFVVFEKDIAYWERTLSHISETIEIILQVQRQWMYLENIFIGSEDIRKQLPQESQMFDGVHNTFTRLMKQLYSTGNCQKACTAPGLLESFQDMNNKLERIQKSLDNYLENKRQQFPRFYFLSSDDLLEILGQAKDPLNVQPHLKKCFEGIKKLDMHLPGDDRKQTVSVGITSPDGEYLPFANPVVTEGRPEEWLNRVEDAMFLTTKKHLYKVLEDSKVQKKEKWVKDNQGQMIITAGQIVWTHECEKALAEQDGARKNLKLLKKKWISYLNKLTTVTRSKLNKIERNKVVALITIEVHARDVIEKLGKANCTSANDFEWVSQLRFYWDREKNDCIVKQVLSVFFYGYEYQGNNGRLVITPLTDRCYMTLGAAMFTRRGGNPLGPAGTGKTETVKDFGKALARYVIVFNCSDGVDYKMTGKMFSGLAQTGAWACLDEFNRIEVEVLSVVATQIACVMQAIKEAKKRFLFLGQEIRLNPSCGIFVTMNPGYAGRSELPDNLKAMLRPVSMMVPDFTLIAEIMMFSEGFSSAKVLAKKMIAIMELSQQQLSKQDHYDYGLRSFVIPIARAAGSLKRLDPEGSEEVILYRTMLDLIKPKLVYLDLPLFMALLSDLFPGVELPPPDGGSLRRAIETELREANLQIVPEFVTKIIQVFDCKVARHGNMLVGRTGSGKSEAWKCLQRALGRLRKEEPDDERYQKVHVYTINPLALSNDELYGCFEAATHEWQDGVLARIMRTVCKDESPDQKWILFDGPVDTLWIESMNTTLDDNKLLTLLSGERIAMTPSVSLLFEVEDLSQASPATVSRAGMIYLNVEDLGWRPFITSWLAAKAAAPGAEPTVLDTVAKLVDKYMEAALEHKRLLCRELVPTDRLSCVRAFTRLFDALAVPENGVGTMPMEETSGPAGGPGGAKGTAPTTPATGNPPTDDGSGGGNSLVEMWFLFCLIWSIGGPLDEDGRKKFDAFMREMDTRYPSAETVFEYFVDPKTKAWLAWETRLTGTFKPSLDQPFFKILVPTVDTVRNRFVGNALVRVSQHTLIVGNVGVGKTMIVGSLLEGLPSDRMSHVTINFSAQTSSNSLQDTIEGKLEKRTKGVFAPAGGKRLVCFIDDLNMPAKSKFGFIPPLELLKLWVDNGFWYDRQKCEVKHIKDMQLLAAMAPPGGGRNAFSQRVQACFATLNVTAPNDNQLKRIFGTILNAKLVDFDDEVKPLSEPITLATIGIYRAVSKELLPTPSKSHYLFNTRDLAKIIQGMMQATKAFYNSKEEVLQLWCHECMRIIADRMWDHADKDWLARQLDEKLGTMFSTSFPTLFEAQGETIPPFVTFMRQNVDPPVYEMVRDMVALKDLLTEKLEDYALEPGHSAMDLVLFRDALHHVCRIHRILMQPRGNALLVGVGGSGRKSLARLAAFVAELKCFTIEITKNYRQTEFREDLKGLYRQAGCANKPTVFLFDETQIVYETFLEDVNNILTSGEVPNLFPKDELSGVLDELRPAAKAAGAGETADALYAYLLERVRTNLHVVLCLSPVGEAFRERCRMFPGLVNCTTIDWFTEWPADALFEVAQKQLGDVDLGSADVKTAVCKVFVTAHQSVEATSTKMFQALKRRNYVTPTNYLETVRGYKDLLGEKRRELGEKAAKLQGGLQKLDETSVQVAAMKKVAEEKKVVVAQAKADCEELLVEIVQDKRVADEQEKQVNAEAQKIGKEAEEANAIAAQVQVELDKALPALREAEAALDVLTKKDMSELKAYAKPPALVEFTLNAVLTVLRRPPNWEEAKKRLADANFMQSLKEFDKDKLDDSLLKKIGKFTASPDFTAEKINTVSAAASGMCKWVHAMETYGYVAKDVAPKRAKLKAAQDNLAKKQSALALAQEQLAVVLAKVQALKTRYDESISRKQALEEELADLEGKLERAEKLVTGLAGERVRWEATIAEYEQSMSYLPGDVVVAAAFMSYAGPFPSEYRDELVKHTWLPQVKALSIPASEHFDFALFLANPALVRDWNIQGLPSDSFSTENGVMVTRGRRWPLMIDPQGQANKWIKNMEGRSGRLKVLNLQMADMARQVENAIQFGQPVLMQDILQEIDPILEPVLAKAFIKRGNQTLIKLGDKEVDYNFDFRLYLTTKLANPLYTPEISTKVMIVNFAVKEQGLEAQLLATVVKNERPDLDKQKNDLVVKVAAGKRTQAELEDTILHLLSTATGSLLDNVTLINTLDQSKTTWEEVNASLLVAEETQKKIEAASQQYRPCSVRASVLYFVLNDLSTIDPMYQFSLDAYNDLFLISIRNSPKHDVLAERIKSLNDYHTYGVYKYTARGLFERHKLLLSLQMCVRILQTANQVNVEEWQFFLRGGTVLDRSQQPTNPAPEWISEEAWDNVTELDALPNFKGITSSFESNLGEWEQWYRRGEPEASELPAEWESKCNELQRLILVRCLRPDRVIFAATTYVSNALGRKYVEPPVLDLGETLKDSTALSPLVFVLSAGVDPTDNLRKLAAEKGMANKFFTVALGQGQAPTAARLIEDGLREGNWVFLANCHLMTSWLPTLDKIIEAFETKQPHENFRLWLSSNPSPAFPIAILQRGLKMTTEPPKGLRANLLRLYNSISEASYTQCKAQTKYQKLLFALTYFHSVLLERRKFRTLGFNIPYDFNDTDFSVSDDLLKSYLDSYENTPWDALKYLIAEANYGGRVTDELDRRVLASYLNKFYCEDALSVPGYLLSPLPTYYVPENGPLSSFRDYILTLPASDRPEAFGQHSNAEISYLIEDSKVLLDSLLSLQPRAEGGGSGGSGGAGGRREDVVMAIATDLLDQVPQPFNLEEVMKAKADDPSALHVVLFQEVERYNALLVSVRRSCVELQRGIKGLVVMSADLDLIFDALYNAKVPSVWLKTYPSLKPLGPWTRDLLQRIEQLATWVEETYPRVYWLSGFTYPTGFLTAVLQTTARKSSVPIDTLSFEFSIINLDEREITAPPKEGVYIKGLYLEGAGWDFENGCLCEPNPMELIVPMPILLFRPVENKKRTAKGIYVCPLYLYPVRTGTRERPSFMINVDLRSGSADPDHWIMRGTALLLSLAT
ncbi:hypothetical protein Vretimale_11536 [Volvox reticuliferus]|uniref:Dynein-1, subspecies f n=2 Tax=Volvox reticuliferus TaxID=1737510 RepID=A0A8J4GHU2_9CHLO|nr:hypothetical protein Vretimale_11536 [Volvox reticuliferus]